MSLDCGRKPVYMDTGENMQTAYRKMVDLVTVRRNQFANLSVHLFSSFYPIHILLNCNTGKLSSEILWQMLKISAPLSLSVMGKCKH